MNFPSFTKAVLYGALLGAVVVLWAVCARERPAAPLPPKLPKAVAVHERVRAADSAELLRWRAAADSARRREAAALDRAARAEAVAREDSARTFAGLVGKLPLAYTARAEEVTTLHVAVEAADTRAEVLDSSLTRTAAEARSADSLLDATVRVAEQRQPPCRVAHVLPCPNRKVVALVGAGFGFALARGWVGAAATAVIRAP